MGVEGEERRRVGEEDGGEGKGRGEWEKGGAEEEGGGGKRRGGREGEGRRRVQQTSQMHTH